MPRKKMSEEQIAFALRQADAGTPVAEICRRLGVSEASFYRWKKVIGPTAWSKSDVSSALLALA